jgi:hypothetical protein
MSLGISIFEYYDKIHIILNESQFIAKQYRIKFLLQRVMQQPFNTSMEDGNE